MLHITNSQVELSYDNVRDLHFLEKLNKIQLEKLKSQHITNDCMIWPERKSIYARKKCANKPRFHEFFKIEGDPYESPDDEFTKAYKMSKEQL